MPQSQTELKKQEAMKLLGQSDEFVLITKRKDEIHLTCNVHTDNSYFCQVTDLLAESLQQRYRVETTDQKIVKTSDSN